MLPLARALGASGHEVRWAAAPDACSVLREKGFEAVPAGLGAHEASPVAAPPPEVAALPVAERPNFMFSKFFGMRRAQPMLADLMPIVEAWEPQLLICDQAELAGPVAAAVAGIPNGTHGFGRLLPAIRLDRGGEAVAPLWRAHDLEPRPYAGTYEHLYLDIYPPSLQTDEVEHVGEIQLLRPGAVPPEPAPEALVWITFGTVFNDDLELFRTAVEAARELDVEVVVTLGPGHGPHALGAQPDNVTVAEFIPQEELIPRCAAVISHAGSGTFLAALAAGVPQLLLPIAADQFLNAEAGPQGGVALTLWPGEVSASTVRGALSQVLADEEMRIKAGRVREEIAAMPQPMEVAEILTRRFG